MPNSDDHSILMVTKNNTELLLTQIEKLNTRLEKNTDEIHNRIDKVETEVNTKYKDFCNDTDEKFYRIDDRLKCVEFVKKSYEKEKVPERLDTLENSTSYYQGAIKILSALFGFVCLVIGWIISVVK